MICGKIVSRQEEVLLDCGCLPNDYEDGYLAECLLPEHHSGPCVFRTPNGKYITWENDDNCDCCGPETPDPCYVWQEISQEAFLQKNK